MILWQALISLLTTALVYGVYKLVTTLYKEFRAPIRSLPGPPRSSWLVGDVQGVFDSKVSDQWVANHGPTMQFRGPLGFSRLFTLDPKALQHIMMNDDIYHRPVAAKWSLTRIVGPGVLVTEGEVHRKQRKIMNPAFGPAQINGLTDIFIQKSIQLRDIWASQVSHHGGVARIDVLSWLSRLTLDVIGLAGFNYDFEALNDNQQPTELSRAFATMFHTGNQSTTMLSLGALLPPFLWIRTARHRAVDEAQRVMKKIARDLLDASKAAVSTTEKGECESSVGRRNLLSLLVKANTAVGLPDSSRLADSDVLAQIPTFVIAGHETASVALAWTLFAVSQNPVVQTKLRGELLAVSTDRPTMDELNNLSYLDCVVRESLRLHPPVPVVGRAATIDDVIPLAYPVTDSKGNTHHSIKIQAGQIVMVPIASSNTWGPIWGEDVNEFKPERWISPPIAPKVIPGVWGNQMTFSSGSRACIGYRFALVQMKALLFTLFRAFEFNLAVPLDDVVKKTMIVQRPLLKSDLGGGNQLPMLVKRIDNSF